MPLSETGSADLASALAKIADGLDDLTGAADATVTLLVARARRLAPVDTGALSRSIHGHGTGSTATVAVGVPYAVPVHFGSKGHRPQPFLYQAVDTERGHILEAYTTDVNRLIKQKV